MPTGSTLVVDGYALTLNQDAHVDGTVILRNGGQIEGPGEIIGTAQRDDIQPGTTYTFNGDNVRLTFTAATGAGPEAVDATYPTRVTVTLLDPPPATPGIAAHRTYLVTATGGSGYQATLRLAYRHNELNGLIEDNLGLLRYDQAAGRWVYMGKSGADKDQDWIELAGVTQFSEWGIGGTSSVMAVHVYLPALKK